MPQLAIIGFLSWLIQESLSLALTKVKVSALTSFFNLTLVLTHFGHQMTHLQNLGSILIITSVLILSYYSSLEEQITP